MPQKKFWLPEACTNDVTASGVLSRVSSSGRSMRRHERPILKTHRGCSGRFVIGGCMAKPARCVICCDSGRLKRGCAASPTKDAPLARARLPWTKVQWRRDTHSNIWSRVNRLRHRHRKGAQR